MSSSSIQDDIKNNAICRLEDLKTALMQVRELKTSTVNTSVAQSLLQIVNKRLITLEKFKGEKTDLQNYDVSDLESEAEQFLEDIELNKRDSCGKVAEVKEIMSRSGLRIIVYPLTRMESESSRLLDDLVLIGFPIGVLRDHDEIYLLLHEIAHHFLKGMPRERSDELLDGEIERLRFEGEYATNLDRKDRTLLAKSQFYKKVKEYWMEELTSDLFGAFVVGAKYLHSFVKYQMNKRYFSIEESHPSNKIRYTYLKTYLWRINGQCSQSSFPSYDDLINTNRVIDIKSKFILRDDFINALLLDFEEMMERIDSIKNISLGFKDL
ncbi:MAG: hypothetical protein M1476_06730 [Candidatus Thermoplasmatota archaeon]|nr:hypothetical protein [Candidatus Thermoplasmatota archaeon]